MNLVKDLISEMARMGDVPADDHPNPEPAASKIGKITIQQLQAFDGFGIVIMGAGQPHEQWVTGLADELRDEGIVSAESRVFKSAAVLTGNIAGDKGRVDLVLAFDPKSQVQVGKLAMWRLQRGGISWTDDFINNYGKDYGLGSEEVDDDLIRSKADRLVSRIVG